MLDPDILRFFESIRIERVEVVVEDLNPYLLLASSLGAERGRPEPPNTVAVSRLVEPTAIQRISLRLIRRSSRKPGIGLVVLSCHSLALNRNIGLPLLSSSYYEMATATTFSGYR